MSIFFKQAIEQAKKDTIIGEKLFKDTERFFKNNRALRNTSEGSSSRRISSKNHTKG